MAVERQSVRVLSLDLFRGIVMFLLIAESAGLYEILLAPAFEGTIIRTVGRHFQHHPWNGLRLWDLGQPLFMFVSGAAMFFSYAKRWEGGEPWRASLFQALKRSAVLFMLGWAIYRVVPVEDNPHGAFIYDMLPQLAVASLAAFLILKRSAVTQLSVSFGLIALTETAYRLWAVIGGGQAFAAGDNFGSAVDRLILGMSSEENWVAFNAVPFTAFIIWGILAGQLLKRASRETTKLRAMIGIGLGGVGVGLVISAFTPVIRRISTSPFVFLSGGICLLALAAAYWLIDVVKVRRGVTIFLAIGMNPIFIYLFAQTAGGEWLRKIALPFAAGIVGWAGAWPAAFATALAVQAFMCLLCLGLYREKIFIRI